MKIKTLWSILKRKFNWLPYFFIWTGIFFIYTRIAFWIIEWINTSRELLIVAAVIIGLLIMYHLWYWANETTREIFVIWQQYRNSVEGLDDENG